VTAYRSTQPAGRVGFWRLLRAEWTKFHTVRGWVIGMAAALLATVLLGVVSAAGSHRVVRATPGSPTGQGTGIASAPVGPDGEPVNDEFYFVHRTLTGDGSITVRITSLAGAVLDPDRPPSGPDTGTPQPWAKAGIMVKAGTTPGSAYVAVLVTGDHGVRMQDNYIHDTAGLAGTVSPSSPRWLRLTRTGTALTGYDSLDGTQWTRIGTAHLPGLPPAVPAGMFVTSPHHEVFEQHFGGESGDSSGTRATGSVDNVAVQGPWSGTRWTGDDIGSPGGKGIGGFQATDHGYTISGTGDIAPVAVHTESSLERTLIGTFAGLVVVVVLGVLFITAEYRRGMIRTTLAATPRRGRVLAAKALVIGLVTFAVGLVAEVASVAVAKPILRHNGFTLNPIGTATQARLVLGSAALLAVAAVLAMATGAVLRRGSVAVAAVIVLVVLPYILGTAAVLPTAPAQWLLRVTPAAAFAVQQSSPAYHQVLAAYTPAQGYYPLAPWAGFAVLCGYAAAVFGLAVVLLRRRDA
jgi:ABC-type transport system involved in multi-copper enzyme maturation permease subunit